MINMDQPLDSAFGKALYAFLGFGIPLILLAIFVLLGWDSVPMMIIVMSWFGLALLFYMGLSDEETIG